MVAALTCIVTKHGFFAAIKTGRGSCVVLQEAVFLVCVSAQPEAGLCSAFRVLSRRSCFRRVGCVHLLKTSPPCPRSAQPEAAAL